MNRTIVGLSAAALLFILGTANGDAQYFGISQARSENINDIENA